MKNKDYPITPAIRLLKANNIAFVPFEYEYNDKGGTKQTSIELNVSEHSVIKTLVMASEDFPFIVLMHGDKEVSTKELARQINVKKVEPLNIENAMKFTGYMFGGTSPFGTRKPLRTFIEESILALDSIYINGGKRGFIIEINPKDIASIIDYETVSVAIDK